MNSVPCKYLYINYWLITINNMVLDDDAPKRVLLYLLKDLSGAHTTTAVATELGISRVGAWKILKKLRSEQFITLKAIGKGKTSASLASLNWENPLVEKTLSLYLTEEAMQQRRWMVNFADIRKLVDFVILYGSILRSPQEAGDIDIVGVASKGNFVKLHMVINTIQKTQSKKIHSINFTAGEFKAELKKSNKAFIDAVNHGIVLFGQESFVAFVKGIML